MGLSKVKSKKQKERLEIRIANWEKQKVNPTSQQQFTKPGSNKK